MNNEVPVCSICGKGREDVRRLASGRRGFICEECVFGALAALAEEDPDWFEEKIAAVRAQLKGITRPRE